MSLSVEWFGVAEAAVSDSRDAQVLVGLDLNLTVAENLPADVRRVLVLILSDDEDPEPVLPDSQLSVEMAVEDPDGRVILKNGMFSRPGSPKFEDIPVSARIIAETQFMATQYGTYRLTCSVAIDGQELVSAQKLIYVVSPDSLIRQ
jgi:hypothetical protein